jgi:outer membrane protein
MKEFLMPMTPAPAQSGKDESAISDSFSGLGHLAHPGGLRVVHASSLVAVLCFCLAKPSAAQPAPSSAAQPVAASASPVVTATEEPQSISTGSALNLRTVVERAVASGPSMRSREAERAAAEARVDQAISAFLPRLKLSATYRRVSPVEITLGDFAIVGARNSGGLFVGPSPAAGVSNLVVDDHGQPVGAQRFTFKSIENQYEVKAELGIPLSDLLLRMQKTVGAAKSATEAAKLMLDVERQKVALDASVAYYNYQRAVSSERLSRQSLTRSLALLEDAKATTRAGVTTELDVQRVDAMVASTEVTVAEAERMKALTFRQLQILLSDDNIAIQPADVFDTSGPARSALSVESATRQALANRTELRAMREALQATDQRESSHQVGRYPRLDGFGQALSGRPNTAIFLPIDSWRTTWAVGLTVSYSPNETISNGAVAAEARADYQRIQADLESAERNVSLQTAAAVLDIQKSRIQIDAAQRAQRAATSAYETAKRLYRAGEATTTDLLDAETRLLAAELQLTHANIDFSIAQIRLEHATGKPLTAS